MQQISRSLIATALVGSALGAPTLDMNVLEQRAADLDGSYHCYSGDGSPSAGWPSSSAWGTFDALWSAQQNVLQNSCGWNGWGANNSPTEIANIKSAILSISQSTGVDSRFILVTIMQESEGCVRVPTTGNGVPNPGLMQSHNGTGTCVAKNPCPAATITQMIQDGTGGTSSGNGLEQVLVQAKPHDTSNTVSQQTYIAARLYNSGSANYTNLNNGLGATGPYVNDVANRLTGWVATTSKPCSPS